MSKPSFGFKTGDAIIVTGAGSGIGRATARNAASVGLQVCAWDVDTTSVVSTVAQITEAGGEAVAVTCDVGSDEQVDAALNTSSARFGVARYLVNNAGPASASSLEFEFALSLCVGSMRRVTNAWLDRGHREGAALVNLASVAGTVIATQPDWYPAAKAAVLGYTRHLASFRIDDVRSNAVAPGLTDTPRNAGLVATEVGRRILARTPLHRPATPDEMSWPILFLLSPLATYVNGSLLVVDGGWTVSQ